MANNRAGSHPAAAVRSTKAASYPIGVKMLHAGMALSGIGAYLSAEGAEAGGGYLLHAAFGFSLTAVIAARLLAGLGSSGPLSFRGWSPFTRRQWTLVREDLATLGRRQVPQRGLHQGLAGLTQAAGLLLFAWMGATGSGLYLLAGRGGEALFESLEELHELGEGLIPLYLLLHVGSVVLHSLAGRPIWQRMWR